jgi:hypothetical protein
LRRSRTCLRPEKLKCNSPFLPLSRMNGIHAKAN